MITLNNYIILGVGRDATDEEIKAGYKRMSIWCHPDKAGELNQLAKMFMPLVNSAYDVLSDPIKRSEYNDRLLTREQAAADEPRIIDPTPDELNNTNILQGAVDFAKQIAHAALENALEGIKDKTIGRRKRGRRK